MQTIFKNKLFVIIAVLVVVAIILVVVLFALQSSQQTQQDEQQVSLPPVSEQQEGTPAPGSGLDPNLPLEVSGEPVVPNNYGRITPVSEVVDPTLAVQLERDGKKGLLLGKLPYQGQNFFLEYDYGTFEFILTIQSADEQVALGEFEAFLQENEIESSSWFTKLVIRRE